MVGVGCFAAGAAWAAGPVAAAGFDAAGLFDAGFWFPLGAFDVDRPVAVGAAEGLAVARGYEEGAGPESRGAAGFDPGWA